ncbi:hypothetical protein DPMN_117377 [Dreissena polymorpha]|uniref:Reelin domain-containing protein n=2 Tax=Dreissena polymorpha TaxID=45954 RepID=A0A9D4KQ97_DREPO|nr:hypothetical protein DPMN_117377 [Dreissena polymorpha]
MLFTYMSNSVTSYPSGAPRSSCENALPFHVLDGIPVEPQNYSSPYIITVNVTSYEPGDFISVRVHSYVGALFKGLFLQVRPLPDSGGRRYKDEPIGSYFRELQNSDLLNCGYSLDTVTHAGGFSKVETTFTWMAPLFAKSDIEVRATILKDFATYWTNVTSRRISFKRKSDDPYPVEKLEKPWVKEIIRTIKAEDNPTLRKQLVKERFAKGTKNAIDPNGYIMVNYVNDMLMFENKFPIPQKQETALNDDAIQKSQRDEPNTAGSTPTHTTTIDAEDRFKDLETTIPLPGDFGIEELVGFRFVEGNASLSDYERCLRDVLRGNNSNIDSLSKLIEEKP